MFAISAGRDQIARHLIEKGSPIGARDKHGWSALHYASSGGRDKLVLLLLQQGADPKLKTKNNQTPIQLAYRKRQLGTLNILMRYRRPHAPKKKQPPKKSVTPTSKKTTAPRPKTSPLATPKGK